MASAPATPRILLISQWPDVKNGEYELIEKIKQTGYEIEVVDYLGFSVASGECLNVPDLNQRFDFAISFHYDTPALLNIKTYLWVANPLQFMHWRNDYRTHVLSNLRSYDDFLYNGSDTLKLHISNVIGPDWADSGLEMYPACSTTEIRTPTLLESDRPETSRKIFYCGVNWERASDVSGRAQGLLEVLQENEVAHFFGPKKIAGKETWKGFKAYKGEIPFDGLSLTNEMSKYGAVLAVSSPAHLKSRTSSSRVFEGVSAGVPVITDRNPHTEKLFGDTVYYFDGETEEENALSIQSVFQEILNDPASAAQKIASAQELLRNRYCFEPCFEHILSSQGAWALEPKTVGADKNVEIFLEVTDSQPNSRGEIHFGNLTSIIEMVETARSAHGITATVSCWGAGEISFRAKNLLAERDIAYNRISIENSFKFTQGEKISLLASKSSADLVLFFDQDDFPRYDHLLQALTWFSSDTSRWRNGLFIGGYFVNDLSEEAPENTYDVLRYNAPVSQYRWRQNSIREHQLGSLVFSPGARELIEWNKVSRLDVTLPVSLIAQAAHFGYPIHRGRLLSLRVRDGYFEAHFNEIVAAQARGFWPQHYELDTNFTHELNALYDIHSDPQIIREIIDPLTGQFAPEAHYDQVVTSVSHFLVRLRPFYRLIKPLIRPFYSGLRRIRRAMRRA